MSKTAQLLSLLLFVIGRTHPIAGPAKVSWEVTHRCNLRCRHCHLWREKESNDLSTEEGKRLIHELASLGTLHLSFTGGEPFLRRDMFDLIAAAHSKGISTGANTNGTRLGTPESAQRVCDSGLGSLFVSLDGPTPESHNSIRGVPHAFDSAIRAIDLIVRHRSGSKPRVLVNTTVTRENVDSLDQILLLAREHGVDGMTMSVLQDVDVFSPDPALAMNGSDSAELTSKLQTLASRSGGMVPHTDEYLEHFATYLEQPRELYKYRCAAGYAMATIHPNGDVYACPVSFARMGSLRENSFREIWYSQAARDVRERIKANRHPICWFDCIAPMNVLLHNVGKLRWHKLLHRQTLTHIMKKVSR